MKLLIWANFKMNKNTSELKEYLNVFKDTYACFVNIDLMVAPVTAWLGIASEILKDSCVHLWAQNMYFEESWAYTWETSPTMLEDLWCSYVILGHSERRQFFWETNESVNKKVKKAIEHGIRPILCIWENLRQKELWLTKEVLKIQLVEWLEWVDASLVDIAYEPVWAIWTGKSATPDDVQEIHNFLRELLWNKQSRIIYGWSVNDTNANELIKKNNVNWFLIGSASLDPNKFLKIIEETIK